MKLTIPELSLVVLIGSSGSGKSTFAKKHFKPTEVISSDFAEVWFRTTKMIRQLPGQRLTFALYSFKRMQLGNLRLLMPPMYRNLRESRL